MPALFSWPTVTAGMGLPSAGGGWSAAAGPAPAHLICVGGTCLSVALGTARRARGHHWPGALVCGPGRASTRSVTPSAAADPPSTAAERLGSGPGPPGYADGWSLVAAGWGGRVSGPAAGLTDRLSERGVLDRFVADVRAGEGRALVV